MASAPATRKWRRAGALDHKACPDQRFTAHAKRAWDRALALGVEHGFRNAQVSVIAPTAPSRW